MKSVRIRSYFSPYFPAFGLNTERSASLRIQSNWGKMRTRITPNTDFFTQSQVLYVKLLWNKSLNSPGFSTVYVGLQLNWFVLNASFFYLLKTWENCKVFWCFQGVEKGALGTKGLTKTRLWHECYAVDFEKLFSAAFLQNIFSRLFLYLTLFMSERRVKSHLYRILC